MFSSVNQVYIQEKLNLLTFNMLPKDSFLFLVFAAIFYSPYNLLHMSCFVAVKILNFVMFNVSSLCFIVMNKQFFKPGFPKFDLTSVLGLYVTGFS